MSDTSLQLFPAIVRPLFLSDHSVASILAPEIAAQQPEPVLAEKLSPSGDEDRDGSTVGTS